MAAEDDQSSTFSTNISREVDEGSAREDYDHDHGEHINPVAEEAAMGKCINAVVDGVYTSPVLKKLLDGLAQSGCKVVPSKFFHCTRCPTPMRGYFDPSSGVHICYNYQLTQKKMVETMIHESVHAYDYSRACLTTSCQHIACTEIRAANLSGECHFLREMSRARGFHVRKRHPECVRTQAKTSLMAHPKCAEQADRTIDSVWAKCYRDTQPFDSIP